MKRIRSVLMVMVIFLMVSLTVSAEPVTIKVDGKLIEVDAIYEEGVMLLNLKEYEKHFQATILKDEQTKTYTVGRPYVFGTRMGTFKIGERVYTKSIEHHRRVMDVPPRMIGGDIYVPLHILCIMTNDIVHYMEVGQERLSLQIVTQDAIQAESLAVLRSSSKEEFLKWEKEQHRQGKTQQRWPSGQIDSMPTVARGIDADDPANLIYAPEVDRRPESRQPTGKHRQYGAFKIPLLKGSKISGPEGDRFPKWFVEEIRQPYGLVILRVHPKGEFRGALELAVSVRADLDLALDGMREILSQCFDPAGVEKIIKQVKQIDPMETERVDTYPVESKSLTTEVMKGNVSGGVTSRHEVPFAKVTISLK